KPALAASLLVIVILILIVIIGSPIAIVRINHQKQQATEKLWDSYLAQARANRWTGRAGRRFDNLEVLKKAAEIRPDPELRNEAIAAMALTDVRVAKQWEVDLGEDRQFLFDPACERYVTMQLHNGPFS